MSEKNDDWICGKFVLVLLSVALISATMLPFIGFVYFCKTPLLSDWKNVQTIFPADRVSGKDRNTSGEPQLKKTADPAGSNQGNGRNTRGGTQLQNHAAPAGGNQGNGRNTRGGTQLQNQKGQNTPAKKTEINMGQSVFFSEKTVNPYIIILGGFAMALYVLGCVFLAVMLKEVFRRYRRQNLLEKEPVALNNILTTVGSNSHSQTEVLNRILEKMLSVYFDEQEK